MNNYWYEFDRVANDVASASRIPMFVDVVDKIQPKSVLELGCNLCANLLGIYQKYPKCKLYGIDLVVPKIDCVETICGDLLDNNTLDVFDDKQFDLIITGGVLIYFSDIGKIMSTIKRISKSSAHIELHSTNPHIHKQTKCITMYAHNFMDHYKNPIIECISQKNTKHLIINSDNSYT